MKSTSPKSEPTSVRLPISMAISQTGALILLDDMGYGDLSSYGSQAIKTPNIDALAAAGVKFTQYYSPSSSCTPSRAGLLSGRYAPRAGLPTVSQPTGSIYDYFIKMNG